MDGESQTNGVQSSEKEIWYMEIDTRRREWCWKPVKLIEVIHAVEKEYRNDFTKSVAPLRGQLLGVFKLEADDYKGYLEKSIEIRGVELHLTPRFVGEKRPHMIYGKNDAELYVTIYDAYQRPFRHISHDLFNEYFESIEGVDEIVVQTQPQRTKNTTVLNGNRFLKIQLKNDQVKDVIGSSIEIKGIRFNLMYNGMTKYCFLCEMKHGRECPTRTRFEFLKKLRAGKTQKRKVYSDSSLRNANQLALTTDIACMSGAGVGQICNAVELDEKHEEIIIFAGNNEITRTRTLEEFVYTVEKMTNKLQKLANETEVTLLLPSVPTQGAEELGKARYWEEKASAMEMVTTVKLTNIEYDFDNHPTQKGTADIISQIQVAVGESIILGAADEVTTKRKYSQVQPIYKVGCRGCDAIEYTPELCENCVKEAKLVDTQYLKSMIDKIQDDEFPRFEIVLQNQIDFEMKDVLKRSREKDDENYNAKNAKT